MKKNNVHITKEQLDLCNKQLNDWQNQIDYDTKDYPLELLNQKFLSNDFFIPDYQREYIWNQNNKTRFIESILLGFPIPFMFFADCEDGRYEIIDGAQRIQTIVEFFKDELILTNLEKLNSLNGFKYSYLPIPQQRRFKNRTLRIVILDKNTSNDIRQDLFNRINTTGQKANDSEIRRGSYKGKLTTFIEECRNNQKFMQLCPIPENKRKRCEDFELILRFFAYLNDYTSFVHSVKTFLDEFLQNNLNTFDEKKYKIDFNNMLDFVEEHFEFGFAKSKNARTTPRVRFEAIAVGTGLALKTKPNLKVSNVDWIFSEDFQELTTTDASNNTDKLKSRIEYVRDKLLEASI